uniref:Desmoglein 2 n=1 Tax=Pelusios castaneus TaxID=367368 RepID=A0A8C8RN82_9SAUR
MARLAGAGGLEALLLVTICLNFGNGLHLEVFNQGGGNDHLSNQNSKARQKREWLVPPALVSEEDDSLNMNPIAKISSDHRDVPGVIITYSISGQGVTEPPYGLFVIDGKTGDLNITRRVNREQTPVFYLKGYARDQNGKNLEPPLDLRIKVKDVNDNPPKFTEEVFIGSVEELNEKVTLVMKINATDADEPQNLNSKIAFKIISENSGRPGAFQINKNTGEIRTAWLNLDREEKSSYTLIVEARDRDGDEHGLANTCTVKIKILDVNDNLPVFERESYEASVEENRAYVEMIRLKVIDKDEEFSDNWLANFTIIGDREGYFRIETDTQTNEGILTLVKAINYEEIQSMNVSIVVTNKAAFHKSISQTYKVKPVPVTIKVKNVPEGPVFNPHPMVIQTNESMSINQIIKKIQVYEDYNTTKVIKHIRYIKKYDVDDWITIDSTTGEIRLIKVPDYESSNVINGTYTVIILAKTNDYPQKTATGTIRIQVLNENDNCPTILAPARTVCSNAKFFSFTAEDRDGYPYGAPFTFTVIDEPKGMAKKWVIGDVNETSMKLFLPKDIKPSTYQVPVLVKDVKGFSCAEKQSLMLTVCRCVNGDSCQEKRSNSRVVLGAGAIALIILAILLLLLLPLLLFLCRCGSVTKGFTAIPDNNEETLHKWNSEGAAPEDKAALITPTALDTVATSMHSGAAAAAMGAKGAAAGGDGYASYTIERYGGVDMGDSRWEEQRHLLSGTEYGAMGAGGAMASGSTMTGAGGATMMGAGGATMMGAGEATMMGAGGATMMRAGDAINEEFLRDYFNDKAFSFADADEAQPAKDCLLLYCQEEVGSLHGSVGCCSFIEDDLDDHFLDDLGDKFKTLADICLGKQAEVKASQHSSHVLKDRNASPAVNESGLRLNDALPESLDQRNAFHLEHAYSSGTEFQPPEPVHTGLGSETVRREVVTETSFASMPGLPQAKPIPDTLANSNVIMTQTSYAAGPSMRPTTVVLDPQFKENIVVTERVLAPASSLQDVLEIPDSQYVVVRERETLLVPSSEVKASLSIPNLAERQNVVVTERAVTPTAGLQSSYKTGAELSGIQSIRGQTAISGPERQECILITDPLLNQTGLGLEDSSTLSQSSKVTKYSTVQYTRS